MSDQIKRDSFGRFLKGNPTNLTGGQIGALRSKSDLGKYKEMWRKAHTFEDVIKLKNHLWDLAFNSPDERVKLAATIHIADRLMGKPTESLVVSDQQQGDKVRHDLSKEQVQKLDDALSVLRNSKQVGEDDSDSK